MKTLNLDTPIEAFDLSVRSYNILKEAGIKTKGDYLSATTSGIPNWKFCGFKSFAEMEEAIAGRRATHRKKFKLLSRAERNDIKPKEEKPQGLFLGIREVASQIGLCYRSIHRAVKDGRIKSVRFGGAVKIPIKEFQRIIENGF